jgi:ADP-ribosylglycohydrolase
MLSSEECPHDDRPKFVVSTVRIASNHDGDNDSTASIAGQIWGAWKGLKEIPHGWIRKLDVLVPVLRLAQKTLDSSSLG